MRVTEFNSGRTIEFCNGCEILLNREGTIDSAGATVVNTRLAGSTLDTCSTLYTLRAC